MTNIQFIRGVNELSIPDIKLTRSRDGSTGTANFFFKSPNILTKNISSDGDITGMYLIDKEGILRTTDVTAKFINGKPIAIEGIYIMKTSEDWDRFMRFMESYSKKNKLVFIKSSFDI
jgi:photosystem II protein